MPVDVLGVSALIVGSMQFMLQLKTYLTERKKRKQEEQQQQQHLTTPSYPQLSSPVTYCICYHIHQASYVPSYYYHVQYMPAPPFYPSLPLHPPSSYSHNSPAPSYSRSLPAPVSSDSHASLAVSYPPNRPSYDWPGLLGGRMELLRHQQAPHNTHNVHEILGIRTGAYAHNDHNSSYQHWKFLQEEGRSQRSVAVVDWSEGKIDMFMEIGGAYFRNYRIRGCDVEMFAYLFKEREVFSGEIKEQKLQRFNKEMKMVEMQRSGVQSTNSWMSLGIYDESEDMQEVIREQRSFIQTVRGAVFGLVCCAYEAPHDLNVDMESPHNISYSYGHLQQPLLDVVRINTHQHPSHLLKRHTCFFSVFSFADHGWSAQDILLG